MATIAIPTWFKPASFSLRMSTNQRMFSSNFGGSEQVADMLNDRWMATLTLPARINTEGGALEALIASFRGQTNTCNLWHMQRPVPRGTMRGIPATTSNPAAQGTATIGIATSIGATLLAGDMIGAGGLLLQVAEDCTADGIGLLTVPLVNRLRKSIAVGSPVTWDKPTAPFRLMTNASVLYQPGYAEGVSLDFAEAIA